MTVRVETSARLHFGFQNLALAHERLYGGIGVSLDEPRLSLEVDEADSLECQDPAVHPYVEDALEVLDVPGARVRVREQFGRHIGLGSGTQLALASLVGIARVYDQTIDSRELAPEIDRGGRSGVGVATFENGGFVVDGGHRSEQFTTRPPETGNWTVPAVVVQRPLPDDWRFLLVTPDASAGQSGETEQASMQSVVERADPGIADDIATVLTRQLLPAIAEGNLSEFGTAIERIGRLNGAWYADEQGGVYRPPAGTIISELQESRAISGAGQSSWGPTVYGVTHVDRADSAHEAGERVLANADIDGTVRIVAPSDTGVTGET